MLDFSFITDEKPMYTSGLSYADGIEYEEFEEARKLKMIENHLDYYGKFRWASQQIKPKHAQLTPAVTATISNLASILKRAFAADCGLVAFGD
jgi:hypothetical protein